MYVMGRNRLGVTANGETSGRLFPALGRFRIGEATPPFALPLCVLARRSEEELLRRLIGDHENAIRRLAHSMLRDIRDVDEAVLDTFVKAHGARRQYRSEASERTWLHRICFNLCVDRLRRTTAECVPLDPDVELAADERDPTLRLALWGEIETLPLGLQAVFRLKHAGYSVTEIAEMARLPRTTVSGHYNRACEQLRERLIPYLTDSRAPRKPNE
jgi:RNA polymerase sigma-70 factor (ECF subfamily)